MECPNCKAEGVWLEEDQAYRCQNAKEECFEMRWHKRGADVHILPEDMHIFFKASQAN